jgi:hypothetical protein
MTSARQLKRKAEGTQIDLFGDAAPAHKRYVPPTEIVRNTLKNLLNDMRAARTWPWSSSIVEVHRERHFAYLCGLLPDREEAARWRALIDAEIARLDAAA